MMNQILGYVRRCVEDYDMIQAGDGSPNGVSGGKDSLTLLVALARLSVFYPKPFTVEAFTLDMGHVDGGAGMDFSHVAELCGELGVPIPAPLRDPTSYLTSARENPCSMCAKMRRGVTHNAIRGEDHQDRPGPPF